MPIVVLYFPPEGYLQSICLLILFIYPSKVMSNCVSFHLCVLNWLSQYTSLFSAFYKHSYQWIASACRNFHGSKFCLGNTPGSPLLSKNVVKTTRHHHIQCLQILLYTGGSAVCTCQVTGSGFYMGLKCCLYQHVSISFTSLTD